MKYFSSLLILATMVLLASSCRKRIEGSGRYVTVERNVSPFTEIESDGNFNVTVKQDSVQSVTLYGEDNILPHLTTRVEGHRLRIYYDHDLFKKFDNNGVVVHVTVPELNSLNLTGSGNINGEGILNTQVLFATLSGSGKIDFNVNCVGVLAFLTGSGDVSLHGNSTAGTYTVSGSGDVHAFDLLSDDVNVTISGSGDCEVHAEKTLKVKISGSGDVRYIGHPDVQTSINGSGSVRPL
jgi:hypothetical protein